MFKTLYSRLAWSITALFLLMSAIVIAALQYHHQLNQDLANQRMHQDLAEHIAKDLNPWPSADVDKAKAQQAFELMMILGPAIELYITDLSGQLLAYDAQPTELQHMQIDPHDIQRFLGSELANPVYGIDPRSDKRKVFSATEIIGPQGIKGYLYIIIGGQAYDQVWSRIQADQNFFNLIMILALVLFALFVATLLILRVIVKPINLLIGQIGQYQAQSMEAFATPLSGSADMRRLQKAFYTMAEKIDRQFAILQRKDQMRKDMLVQISHDLKTPIAAQHAYLETLMLHQQQVDPETQRGFIASAYKNVQLLKCRVDEVLQLTRLEQGLVSLYKERFDLKDFVATINAAVQPIAAKKNTQLYMPEVSGQCYGDAAKLNRVIINLLENAISHCPNGQVEFILQPENSGWKFMVKDDGVGIDQENLDLIFTPYYRNRADSTGEHLGLGLAICQQLVALLGGELKVCSEVGQGTCFCFVVECGRLP